MNTPMRILVTGGAGFIGSNLCRRLVREGHRVACLDNLHTGRRENVADLAGAADGFAFVEHDVTEPLPGRLGDFDRVYHLACPASPPHYQADKEKTLLTCVLGMKNVLDYARGHGGARVLQASTSEVYGDPDRHPQPEDYVGHVNPIGPRACYDEGKRAAETLCFAHREKYGAAIRLARIFNTYGPGMDPGDGRVVSNFIVQALAGKPLTLYGDGAQTRSFCYVDDLLEGLTRLMEYDEPGFIGPVNLGNPGEFTIRRLAELVLEMVGGAARPEHRPLPADDPRQRRPDISRARQLLGWEPRIPLREGLEKTIPYFRRIVEP